MNLEEKKINSSSVFKGRIFNVEVDEVELPDGRHSKRECVRHPGGAAVLLVQNGKIALVRQFRYLYGEEIYEIPAGKLNAGEDAQTVALRELEEETGYRANKSAHLIDIYPTPGYTDEIIHIYYVSDAQFVGQRLDCGEFLNVCFVQENEVFAMIKSGKIKDAKTICAVMTYFLEKT